MSNVTIIYNSLTAVLTAFRYSYEAHLAYLCITVPIGMIGLCLNMASFVIFCKNELDSQPIFVYLRVYTFINMITSLCYAFIWTFRSRFIPITNNLWMLLIGVRIIFPLNTISYFFGCLIDISLLVNRMGSLKYKCLLDLNPMVLMILGFLASLVFCVPWCYFYDITSSVVLIESQNATIIYEIATSSFRKSAIGRIYWTISAMTRDIFLFGVEVLLNICTYILFRAFMNRKGRMVGFQSSVVPASISRNNFPANVAEPRSVKANKKASQMILLTCLISLMQHSVAALCFTYAYLTVAGPNLQYVGLALDIAFDLKVAFNFFVYYRFNSVFKKAADNFICRIRSVFVNY